MRLRRFVIEGSSMLPTLASGDYVVGIRRAVIHRQDLVAFPHPDRSDFWLVKRIMATEGVIDLAAGTIDETPYVDAFRGEIHESGRFEIGPDEMFVLSDNRSATRADSRTWGAIPSTNAYVLILVYWPPRSARRL